MRWKDNRIKEEMEEEMAKERCSGVIVCHIPCPVWLSDHYISHLRDQAIDSEEVVTPLMLDGTYLSRNFATLGPMIRQPPCDLKFY